MARGLIRRKNREQTGLFLVEGLAHVGAALEAGYPLEFFLTSPDFRDDGYAQTLLESAAMQDIPGFQVAADVFDGLATKDNPQGILAVARCRPTALDELAAATHPWLAAAVAPQDPGNVGTLLRTLDAVGAGGLILLDGGVDPTHPTAVRASLGALFWLPVAQATFEGFAHWSRRQGYQVYGTSARAARDYRAVEFSQPAILLLGSERHGLSAEHVEFCDVVVRLPMQGHVSSLNLSVAAGVLLYAMQDGFSRPASSQ